MRTIDIQANDWLQNKDIISSKEMITYPDLSRLDEIPDWSKRKKELSDLLRTGIPVEEVLTKAKEYGFKEPFLSRLIKKY